ncbi:hypothetical protein LDENG_00118440 [Lucifuga dentata]|nr:hypothetical protein LDENG_00118440 [Lucifuga dentata]
MNQLSLLTLAALLCSLPKADGGKVLVPVDGSHWVNMKVLIEELHSRGHNITVIHPISSLYIKAESPHYQSVTFNNGHEFNKNIFHQYITTSLSLRHNYYTPFVHRHFGPDVHYKELVQAADIWLMRNDFTLEFPRPTMPNIVYIGGFQCKPSRPLPQHLEDFVQSSAEHGIIIMSLGTLVGSLPEDIAEHIAAAFAQLPQKVIWRHTGKRPSTLGNNTLLLDWLPQNDLLGHPKTRVFVAHGGTNGIQEAIYHGVPILGLPLMYDQDDNLFRMKARGVARVLDIGTLDKDVFLEELKAVLYEPSYREKMWALSRLHRDQPMKPLDRAIFWIEFVMRHKGAAHLKTSSFKMSWIQYNSIDVMVLLLASIVLILLIFILTMKCLCRRVFGRRKGKTD